jgi:hypothetical protein
MQIASLRRSGLVFVLEERNNLSVTLAICGFFAVCECHAGVPKKNLDSEMTTWHLLFMSRFVVKVDRTNRIFRLVIPRSIIQLRRWDDVKYVIVDDSKPDHIEIRRFIDFETHEKEDN